MSCSLIIIDDDDDNDDDDDDASTTTLDGDINGGDNEDVEMNRKLLLVT